MSDIDLAELLEEREWRRCAPDTRDPVKLLEAFVYFCHTYAHIKHPERGRIRFDLFDSQRESVDLWIRNRYSLMSRPGSWASDVGSVYALLALTFLFPTVSSCCRTERTPSSCWPSEVHVQVPARVDEVPGPPMNATLTKLEYANESYIESCPRRRTPLVVRR
jgi:hypothetical protein